MFDARAKKIFRDLLSNKARTGLVVLAISIGVFSFGSVFITQEILLKNLDLQYKATDPSTISLYLSGFDETLVRWVESQNSVEKAQAKFTKNAKIELADSGEKNIVLNSVPDFGKMELNLLEPKIGDWPPEKGEIFLERNSYKSSSVKVGDILTIKVNDKENRLAMAGVVYDNSAIPYMFTNQMTAFISWDTVGVLGLPEEFNTIDIQTALDIVTLQDAEKLAFNLTENLKKRGVTINGTSVLTPNEHWAENNSKAFTAILSVIGVFSLVLSGFLVVNTISAILTQQKKQIGVMRAVGGSRRQITALYIITVLVYGALALFIALPVGVFLGYTFLKLVTDFLNLDINVFYLPSSVFIMQVAAALAVPVAAALFPVLQSSKYPIHQSLSDYQPQRAVGRLEQLLFKLRGLPRPYLISIRNTFRKKGRLALTLGTLIVAGGVFIAVVNVRSSMYLELDRILQMFDFGVSVSLSEPFDVAGIEKRIKEVDGVGEIEARNGLSARRIKNDGSKGNSFGISGLPPDTVFSHPVVLSGRWLVEGERDNIVLSNAYIEDNPDLSVGDSFKVSYGDNKEKQLEIVGIIAMSGDQKIGFMDFPRVALMNGKPRLASSFLIKTIPSDNATQVRVMNAVVDRLERSGITIASSQTRESIFASAANQFNFLIFFLLTMAVMIASVGGLGLAGTMSLNVMERTREIGIMRSVGAGNSIIREVVLIEGIMVGVVSFLLALPFSVPVTYGLCYAIGNAFFGRTLVFDFVPIGAFIWLFIILIIAVFASIFPARRASKISISETLAYE
jgi:putative ABC transport system permease protein